MPERRQSRASAVDAPSEEWVPDVRACRSRPGKVVFIEADNRDGWIATDAAVEVSE